MNLALFFEGTGQGVAGRITNVTRLHDLCLENSRQKRHLESGPGTHFGAYLSGKIHGSDWQGIFRDARRWFESNYETLPKESTSTKVFLFGFSRGALIARHFAAWLDKLGVEVAYMGLWDTVDSTIGLDVSEECPPNVLVVRHAIARDEMRRFFAVVPIRPTPYLDARKQSVTQMVFPGCHSDVGGLYDDNHVIADVSLAWILAAARRCGLRIKRVPGIRQKVRAGTAVLHSSLKYASNLFGAFSPIPRLLDGVKRHPSCHKCAPLA